MPDRTAAVYVHHSHTTLSLSLTLSWSIHIMARFYLVLFNANRAWMNSKTTTHTAMNAMYCKRDLKSLDFHRKHFSMRTICFSSAIFLWCHCWTDHLTGMKNTDHCWRLFMRQFMWNAFSAMERGGKWSAIRIDGETPSRAQCFNLISNL